MPKFLTTVLAALALAPLGGCIGLRTDDPYPVSGNPVNPTPVAGYVVRCQSEPSPFHFVFNDFLTACQQEIAPASRRAVVRAKG
jgi:hypothetical protein